MRKTLMTKTLMTATILAALALPALADEVLKTGGEKGDYNLHFGPPVTKLLNKALNPHMIRVERALSDGTVDNLNFVLEHQDSYALAQGDAFVLLQADKKYADKYEVLAPNIANEALLAIMNSRAANGGWAGVSKYATRVHFYLPPENSGPAVTFRYLQSKDPNGLGKATSVTYAKSTTDALRQAAADQSPAVVFMVQFGNPKNPTFQLIHELGLQAKPVMVNALRELKAANGADVYTFCAGVQVADDVTVDTACSPVMVLTGKANADMDAVKATFSTVTAADFEPQEPGIRALWKKLKVAGSKALSSSIDAANSAAKNISDRM